MSLVSSCTADNAAAIPDGATFVGLCLTEPPEGWVNTESSCGSTAN